MHQSDGRRRDEPERRDEEDERGPLISSENDDEPARPNRRFEQFEEWEKPRELKKNTEGQRSRAGRSAQ